ncbi:MAG: hypothetical protein M0R32_09205 [Candidatus Cloacimonetes bacterium]|jgi:hypothetical protein|nr:hypothetical protein [Candidatus Cloacimonadota bacterium]
MSFTIKRPESLKNRKKPTKKFRKTSNRLKDLAEKCPICDIKGTSRCSLCISLKEIIIEVEKLEAFRFEAKKAEALND